MEHMGLSPDTIAARLKSGRRAAEATSSAERRRKLLFSEQVSALVVQAETPVVSLRGTALFQELIQTPESRVISAQRTFLHTAQIVAT